ncbi:MAG: hypothetical protein KDA22_05000, partial [Phycisphaerales bacterium]|nr:hypothetical protein [Phycisphaerales bacterium]
MIKVLTRYRVFATALATAATVVAAPIADAEVLYVRADAPPGGEGTSWGTAFQDLQDALSAAEASNGSVASIWVAAGTYRPDAGTGLRSLTFALPGGVAVLGGFAGDETDLAQRNPAAN